jgi:ubiquinone biosynthesis protein
MARHGLKELFGRPDEQDATARLRRAKRLRAALEELGPTFSKLGQVLSTRPDLLPPEYIDELIKQDHVPPMAEHEVVRIMEHELGVPWEDVFESIGPTPLAAGTIAQVHRATLTGGDRVVVKVQRRTVRDEIEQDLALLKVFADRVAPGASEEHRHGGCVQAHREFDFTGSFEYRADARHTEGLRSPRCPNCAPGYS